MLGREEGAEGCDTLSVICTIRGAGGGGTDEGGRDGGGAGTAWGTAALQLSLAWETVGGGGGL